MEKDLQHSIDFITQKTGGKSGFSVPNNYFDGVEDTFFSHITESQLPKKETSFDVPKDYFAKLEDEILSKVTSEEKTVSTNKGRVISLRERMQSIIPYASVASVLVFVSVYFFNNYNRTTSLDDISIADLETWYDVGYDETNNTELAMVFETTDFTEDELTSVKFDTDIIENYLNSTDNTSLLNEIP